MRPRGLPLLLALALGGLAVSAAGDPAPRRDPHVGYVYPAGGQRGTTVQALMAGQYLANADQVYVSGGGVSASVVKEERQLTPKEQTELKETLSKLQEQRKQGQAWTEQDVKAAEEIRTKLARFGRRLANPSLGELITLEVSVAATAVLGRREIRLATPAGLSNPLVFHVGELPEVTKEPWQDLPKTKFNVTPQRDVTPPERRVVLPATLNGQIPPGGVDRYRFAAPAGQSLVVAVRARDLIPYIADAVPGWLQATVALYDAQGREVAYADDYRFQPDPVLLYRIPASGDFVLEIKDALYRGREDFVYRITAGELPFVTGVFPLGGRIGAPASVAVTGWNLPFDRLPLPLEDQAPGIHALSLEGSTNRVPYAADTLPEALEQEPNDTPQGAQPVVWPVVVNGRIDRPGDMDLFRLDARAGDEIVAEVTARRLDSPLDSMLLLTDGDGRPLAFNDDHEDKGLGLDTHYADSFLSAKVATTGPCFLRIGDTQHGGGAAYAYRLRISAPRPDFELRVTPSSLAVRSGSSVPLTVHVLRRDGFSGEIALSLAQAPPGFTLTGARLAEGQPQGRFTLDAPAGAGHGAFHLRIEGRGTILGSEVVRQAVAADDVMQSFAYRHLVPAQNGQVVVLGPVRSPGVARILTPTPVRVSAGGSARVEVRLPVAPWVVGSGLDLDDPPDGLTIEDVTVRGQEAEFVLRADPAKVKPGLTGSLIVRVSADAGSAQGKPPPPQARRRAPLGWLPAIPFEVVAP